jgi:pyridoxine 5-phosphate synthase
MTGLAFRIDHIAHLRHAGGGLQPDPVTAALLAELAGADGIAAQLRRDRQPVQERDVRMLRDMVQHRLILEMGVALDIKPDLVNLVPEKETDFGPEGGLDLMTRADEIAPMVDTLQNSGIPTGVRIDSEPEQVRLAHRINATAVEVQTTGYCEARTPPKRQQAFARIVDAVKLAHKLRLTVRAGGGLNYVSVKSLAGVAEIDEFCIGRSIIARAVLVGLDTAVRSMIDRIRGR